MNFDSEPLLATEFSICGSIKSPIAPAWNGVLGPIVPTFEVAIVMPMNTSGIYFLSLMITMLARCESTCLAPIVVYLLDAIDSSLKDSI